jgi:hypothetical protein
MDMVIISYNSLNHFFFPFIFLTIVKNDSIMVMVIFPS